MQENNFDLLVIPQLCQTLPGPHLTPNQAQQAQTAWHAYGNTVRTNIEQTWTIAVAHLRDGELTITSKLTIPHLANEQAA
ncbi:hypothetical protein H0194_04790 [Corynebacterium incognita]|uniref:Uncharacterized protein n=1 Tax=Corynebacterium incognita TaxID=2754725 RepID=A0A7G7CRT1_9CORY|nr:hypothetical protein [Corynebacterium incognita]QNE90297.1 hypothetical protein H0194_04790 [Corynebacterium incognita]